VRDLRSAELPRGGISSRALRRAAFALAFALAIGTCTAASVLAQETSRSPELAEIAAAQADLRAEFPDLRIDDDGFGRIVCYGAPVGGGVDPAAAAEAWLERHATALGLLASDLELLSVTPLSDPRATVFAYRLWSGATPIRGGVARLLVRDQGDERGAQVVYAAAHGALAPEGGYPPVRIAADAALATARAALPRPLLFFRDPALVIESSATRRAPSRLVWHVEAGIAGREAWTVVIDPVTGAVLEVIDEWIEVDVSGTVTAAVTPANEPDTASNPPVVIPLGGARVRILGGAETIADAAGSFTIPHPGAGAVTVEASLVGEWAAVFDSLGPEELVTASVTPPGPVVLGFAAAGDPLVQAQLNAFHFATATHDFVRARTTGIPGIDAQLPCFVNDNGVCNAGFDPFSVALVFFPAGGGCVNTSFSSVVAHEYGHFIVYSLGLAQESFGEGFGDVVSMLQFDDPIIGRDFSGPGTWVRNPPLANVQYPCNGSVHFCGQLLGGVWWRIREQFGALHGSAAGLAESQQLFADWSLIAIGGSGESSAHPLTAIEVLTVDDDDGSLANATPRFTEICTAFAGHSVACPATAPVLITFPVGRPELIPPGIATDLRIDIESATANPLPGSANLFFREEGALTFSPIALQSLGGNEWSATFPPQSCGGVIEYYIAVGHDAGGTATQPEAGASAPFTAAVFAAIETVFSDDFEAPLGWSGGVGGDTATAGVWTRVDPNSTAAAPGSDHSAPGSICFVTGQGVPGGPIGTADVDGGTTTLLSPVLDLSAPGDYAIRYWRWFSNDAGAQPNTEAFTVSISGNGGQSWSAVEVVGPTGPETSGGWFLHEFSVADFTPPTASMRLRFVAQDPDPGSLVEAAVDDVEVIRRVCAPPPEFLRGDANGDQARDLSDAVLVLVGLFSGGALPCLDAADTNDDGLANIVDAVVLLEHLFAAGGPLPPPFATCGEDPTDSDQLGCSAIPNCP